MYLATEFKDSVPVEEAMHGRFKKEWRQAYQSKFDSLCIDNKLFDLVPRTNEMHDLDSKEVLKVKSDDR